MSQQNAYHYVDINVGLAPGAPTQNAYHYVDANVGITSTPTRNGFHYVDINIATLLRSSLYYVHNGQLLLIDTVVYATPQ